MKGGILFQCARVRLITNSEFFEEIWLMVASLPVWHIWIRHSKFDFQQQKLSRGEVMLNISFERVTWLCRRYDSVQGESNETKMAQIFFEELKGASILKSKGNGFSH